MSEPRDIIRQIRRDEYQLDIQLPPEAEPGRRSMHTNLNNALRTLSQDLYSKDTHFVLELVQNADDNEYPEGVDPALVFRLSAEKLIVENNEVGFLEKNVQALCRIGQSTKAKRAGFIGEKGIGFKSVFTVTNRPEIHSNGFHFCFDLTSPEQILGYVVPQWIESKYSTTTDTTLVLPAKPGSPFTTERLGELSEEVLLFLRKLRTIEIENELEKRTTTYRKTETGGLVTLAVSDVTVDASCNRRAERRYRTVRRIYSTASIIEKKRDDVTEAEVVLAFPIHEDGMADAAGTKNVFAFLPVRDFGFRFLIQADFLLSSNREDIHKGNAWNARARDEIAHAFIHGLQMFRSTPALAHSFLQFVPRLKEISDPFFAQAGDAIVRSLKSTPCILTESGAWRVPAEVLIGEPGFAELYSNGDLKRVLGLEYISAEVNAPKAVLDRLGVIAASASVHLLALLEKDSQLGQRTAEWWGKLYAYCARTVTVESALKKAQGLAILRLGTGELARPADGVVYFPLDNARTFGFEEELTLIDPAVLRAPSGVTEVRAFLTQLGVRTTDPHSLIVNHILPRHGDDKWKESDFGALVGHVSYLREHFEEYVAGAVAAGQTRQNAISLLGDTLYLQTKKEESGQTFFARAADLYVGSEYGPALPIEKMLGDRAQPVRFIANVYLASMGVTECGEDKLPTAKAWRDFFRTIGVNSSPKIEITSHYGKDYKAGPELEALLSSAKIAVRRRTIEELDREWAYYGRFLTAELPGRRGQINSVPSQFSHALRSAQVPTKAKSVVRLCDTFFDDQHVRAVFGSSVPYLDADVSNPRFLSAAGVTHRVDAAACFRRLDSMRASAGVRLREVKLIYRELERLGHLEGASVASGMRQIARIYIPSLKKWYGASDVVWESSGPHIDSLHPPIGSFYREYRDFFCKRLLVPQLPTAAALVGALERIPEFGESVLDRHGEALRIYRRLSRYLDSEHERDPEAMPAWLDMLRGQDVFVDHVGRMVAASDDLFIADDDKLAEALKQHELISFLPIPSAQIPPIEALLSECGVPRLSQVAKSELLSAEGESLDAECTARVRTRLAHLMRLVYSRANGVFQRAHRLGVWPKIASLQVRTALSLTLEVSVGDYSVRVPAETCRTDEVIYLSSGLKGKMDRLARELCLFFGGDVHALAEAVYRVLTASSEMEIAEYFDVRGIPDIPPEELVDLEILEDSSDVAPEETSVEERPSQPVGDEAGTADGRDSEFTGTPPTAEAGPEPNTAVRGNGGRDSPANHGVTSVSRPGGDHERQRDSSESHGGQERRERRPSGRLISYAEPPDKPAEDQIKEPWTEERLLVSKAAVTFVLESERGAGCDVVEMPFMNEGFDIRRATSQGEEYIEVKGLSHGWDAAGVILTPAELRMAERHRVRYWLYVVEFATDPMRRRAYKVQDPFGKVGQFRFDAGWKGAAEGAATARDPAPGLHVTFGSEGSGKILSVMKAGPLRRLTVKMESGEEVTKTFDPKTMLISGEV